MATVKQTAFRFTAHDLALIEALQQKLGIVNRTEILRLALRRLADIEGVPPPTDPPQARSTEQRGRKR